MPKISVILLVFIFLVVLKFLGAKLHSIFIKFKKLPKRKALSKKVVMLIFRVKIFEF